MLFFRNAVSQTKATGSLGQYMSKMNKSPAKWINESTWKECLQLSSSILTFAGLCSNIAVNGAFWSKFSTSENPFKFLEDDHRDIRDSAAAVDGMNGPFPRDALLFLREGLVAKSVGLFFLCMVVRFVSLCTFFVLQNLWMNFIRGSCPTPRPPQK